MTRRRDKKIEAARSLREKRTAAARARVASPPPPPAPVQVPPERRALELLTAGAVLAERERVYPVPEVFPEEAGRGWVIRDSRKYLADVDPDRKVIFAPLGNDAVSHCVRMQQIARIRWDDRTVNTEGLKRSLLFRALEDNRLSLLLRQSGVDVGAGFLRADTLDNFRQSASSPAENLALLLLTDYTDCAGEVRQGVYGRDSETFELFQTIRREIQDDPSKATSLRLVRWLRGFLVDEVMPERVVMEGCRGACLNLEDAEQCTGDFDDFFDMAWESLGEDDQLQQIPSAVREQLPSEMPAGLKPHVEHAQQANTPLGLQPWGRMSLQEPPRTLSVLGRMHKKWKSTEEGVFPRFPHRFLTDGRIFARRVKRPGGTVVIDCSGSMGLTGEAIARVVEAAPGCLVACYSGSNDHGVLRILARGGRRVDNGYCASPGGHGNIVDFPALKWAYRQAHPRIWVSDFVVTGIGDRPGTANIVMCAAAVQKGRFFTARNVDEATQVLKRLGRYYRRG
jgi:hypothetical protein